MLCSSFIVWGIYISVVLQLGHAGARAACKINFPYSSPYVSAFYETIIPRKGCTSNSTTDSRQEVHVINLQSVGSGYRNDIAEVNLLIKSRKDEVLWEPVIFILYSRQPVRWRVKTEIFSPAKKRHIFVVPRYSGVKLIKSSRRRRQIRRINNIPSDSQKLLKWAKKEYGAVTSLTELKRGNRMVLSVGLDRMAPAECKIQDNKGTRLSVLATYEQPQIFSGCDVPMSDEKISRVAYIIELEKVHVNPQIKSEISVDLDVRSSSRKIVQLDFWLVLKSPQQVKWNIRTRKLKGYIDIVANSLVNITGIHMDTVGVRMEDISDTKQNLIKWVEYYIGPVAMYSGISLANKVKLVIPDPSPPRSGNKNATPKTVIPAFERPNVTTSVLELVLHSECNHKGQLSVSLKKSDLKRFDVDKRQMTLLNTECKAEENKTNIYLLTNVNSCGTTVREQNGNTYFSNAILIHQTLMPDLLPEPGSGDKSEDADVDDAVEGSGLGSHDVLKTTYMDDEDFQTPGKIRINFTCKVPTEDFQGHLNMSDHHISNIDDVSFKLEVFKTSYFTDPILQFPMSFPANSRIYAKVTINADNSLKVTIQECWLSPPVDQLNAERISLIKNGCLTGNSVRWESGMYQELTQSERFSFVISNTYRYSFLKCQLSACRRWKEWEFNHVPECPENPRACMKDRITSIKGPTQEVTCGPMYSEESRGSLFTTAMSQTILDPASVNIIKQTKPKDRKSEYSQSSAGTVIVDGLDSGTVVGIAFAAFIIGILLMAALWFIHTHTGPIKHAVASRSVLDGSGESTPMSTAPLQINS